MIDVTFLLLIFFMVTSTMKNETALQVPLARHGAGVSTESSIVLTIVAREREPELYLSDGPSGSPAQLSEVPAYVEAGIKEQKRTVIIKADRNLPSGFIEEVARAASEVEGIEKFYVGVQDKPQ
jgi:biopolymer transport protein ExbD